VKNGSKILNQAGFVKEGADIGAMTSVMIGPLEAGGRQKWQTIY
jgi:hypothetical protein